MKEEETLALLRRVRDGSATPEAAMERMRQQPFEDLGYARVDHHRTLRQGEAEVIYGAGKTTEQIVGITASLHRAGNDNIIITRISTETADALSTHFPLDYDPLSRLGIAWPCEHPMTGDVVVAAAGTSDLPVAQEAIRTAQALGSHVTRLTDVGVAGIHRLLSEQSALHHARVVVAVAGMEGALPSVVGGLVSCPVIAVPTSVGYGASFGGLAALLAMLNSCASGISVVNIDNGFGAGFLAHRINQMEGIHK